MYFATFYHAGVMTGKLIEACGDRAVIVLDGREKSAHSAIAAFECVKRGYLAYQLHHGEAFNRVAWSGAVTRPVVPEII